MIRGACTHSKRFRVSTVCGRVSNPTLRVLADLPQQPVSLSEPTLIELNGEHLPSRSDGARRRARGARRGRRAARPDTLGGSDRPHPHDDGLGSVYDIKGENSAIVFRVAPASRWW